MVYLLNIIKNFGIFNSFVAIIVLILSGICFYQDNKIKNLNQKIIYLSQENVNLKEEIKVLKEANKKLILQNKELIKEIKIQKEKYEEKINKLLKLANKPPKIIYIPKVITKKVYITPKECKQMAIMIDEFCNITGLIK